MKIIAILMISFLCVPLRGFASYRRDVQKGNRFYQQGDYQKATEYYQKALEKNENFDTAHFNSGASFYRQQQYPQALEHFQKSLLSDQGNLQKKAQYNLGNTFYQQGIRHKEDQLPLAIQLLEQSLASYQKALDIDPQHSDSQHNYEFVKKELEELKERMETQEQSTCPLSQPKDQESEKQKKSDGKDDSQDDSDQAQPTEEQTSPESQEQQTTQQRSDATNDSDQKAQESFSDSQEKPEQKDSLDQQPHQSMFNDSLEMTPQEAKRLLEDYRQTEEPRGILNLNPERKGTGMVEKDW